MTSKDKAIRFNPFPKLSCKYGAPMGRKGYKLDPDTPPTSCCTSKPQGEYDYGGAYWGYGGNEGPVWAVWVRGKGNEGVAYVRAKSKGQAILNALEG